MLTFGSIASAQQWEIGLNGGMTGYMGDINPSNPLYFKRIGGGIHAKYNINPTWGIRSNASFAPIYGTDEDFDALYQQQRNLKFRNNILELAVMAEFNFFKFIGGREFNNYTPYIFAGLAALHHDPYVRMANESIYLKEMELEIDEDESTITYSNLAMSIPFGAGFKYNFKGPWTFGCELMYRTVMSNYIDNIGGFYNAHVSPISSDKKYLRKHYLSDPSIKLSSNNNGTLRGSGNKFDGFMSASITLTYTFNSQSCYWW